jgi:hypothetical protein
MKRTHYYLIVFLFLSIASFAQQTGVIRGTIKDVKSKEDIIGATVLIQGSTKGAATDINGFFTFGKLAVGTYSLKISFVGYQSKIYENVKVEYDKELQKIQSNFINKNIEDTMNPYNIKMANK